MCQAENVGTRFAPVGRPGIFRFALTYAGLRHHRLRHRAAGWRPGRHGRKPDRQPGGASTGGTAPAPVTASVVSLAEPRVPAAAAKQPVVVAKPAVAAKVVSAQLLDPEG